MFKEKISIVQVIILGVFAVGFLVGLILFSKGSGKKNNEETKINYGVVNIWGILDKDKFDAFKNKIGKKNDKFKRAVIYKQVPKEEFEFKLINSIADGKQPQMILVNNKMLGRLKKRIKPIYKNRITKAGIENNFVESSRVFLDNENVIGFPLIVDPMVMYYNRDIYSTNSIPEPAKDWVKFKEDISKITIKNSKNILLAGAAIGTYDNITYAKELFISLLLQTRINYQKGIKFSENDSSKILATLKFYTSFANYFFENKNYTWNTSMGNSMQLFTASKVATIFGLASDNEKIRLRNPNLNFQITEVPSDSNNNFKAVYADIYGLSLVKNAKNSNGAYFVLDKIKQEESLKEFSRFFRLPSAKNSIVTQKTQSLFTRISNKSAVYAKPVLFQNEKEIEKIIGSYLKSVVYGKIDVIQSTKIFVDEINDFNIRLKRENE